MNHLKIQKYITDRGWSVNIAEQIGLWAFGPDFENLKDDQFVWAWNISRSNIFIIDSTDNMGRWLDKIIFTWKMLFQNNNICRLDIYQPIYSVPMEVHYETVNNEIKKIIQAGGEILSVVGMRNHLLATIVYSIRK